MGFFQRIRAWGKKSAPATAASQGTAASLAPPSKAGGSKATGIAKETSSTNSKAMPSPNLASGHDLRSKHSPMTASGKVTLRCPQPDSTSGMGFEELYKLKGVLGSGAFSTVRLGYHKSDQEKSYAVKCINKQKLTEEDTIALVEEVAILKEFDHEHIICLYDFFEESQMYYLVLERMSGGELFDRIVEKHFYNEKEARDVCKILLEAVGYCHKNNVAHRDLKPENLLLVTEKDDGIVKIADFGFAKRVTAPNCLSTQCGTPGYVAPEILEGHSYDTKADMWSIGVILYILLGGYPPFIENNDQKKLVRKIRRGD